MMNDDRLDTLLNQAERVSTPVNLQTRIEAQAFSKAQEQKISFGLPHFLRDWRWVTAEALSACAMLLIGFYLGLSSAEDVFDTPVITAFDIITEEEDWTL